MPGLCLILVGHSVESGDCENSLTFGASLLWNIRVKASWEGHELCIIIDTALGAIHWIGVHQPLLLEELQWLARMSEGTKDALELCQFIKTTGY